VRCNPRLHTACTTRTADHRIVFLRVSARTIPSARLGSAGAAKCLKVARGIVTWKQAERQMRCDPNARGLAWLPPGPAATSMRLVAADLTSMLSRAGLRPSPVRWPVGTRHRLQRISDARARRSTGASPRPPRSPALGGPHGAHARPGGWRYRGRCANGGGPSLSAGGGLVERCTGGWTRTPCRATKSW
jgi:hypothetical protein